MKSGFWIFGGGFHTWVSVVTTKLEPCDKMWKSWDAGNVVHLLLL